MANQNWYIKVDDTKDIWYEFSAPTTAYPEAVGIALGVSATLPAGASATRRGTFANYPIVRVRLVTADKESRTRLCDMEMLATAITDLPTSEAFGSTITRVVPVRRNYSL